MGCRRSPRLPGDQPGRFLIKTMRYICLVLLLYPAAYRPGEACVAAEDDEAEAEAEAEAALGTSTDTLILCRSCGHELAAGADIRFVPSRLALSGRNDTLVGGRRVNVQLFENPHGHQFEVITFRRADVTRHGPAETHFSWFPGFSWTVATCPRCKTHLGGYDTRSRAE